MVLNEFSDSSDRSFTFQSKGADDTRQLGRDIGAALLDPIVISLIGTLGCGKTTFVQGLAEGLEVPENFYITSPTFTLINQYPGRLPLYHVDLYRLEGLVELHEIGMDEILEEEGVVAVEWAEKLPPDEAERGLTIRFEDRGKNLRIIEMNASGQHDCSLLKTIKQRRPKDNTE